MAECAITGQTVVTQHYCVFQPEGGERRFYALSSPPPVDVWAGTVQTIGVTAEEVAEDIAKNGQPGVLRWNPKLIPTNDGYLKPSAPINIVIKDVSSADAVLKQIGAGSQTRVATQVPVDVPGEGRRVLDVAMDLDIWPPFRGIEPQRHPAARRRPPEAGEVGPTPVRPDRPEPPVRSRE